MNSLVLIEVDGGSRRGFAGLSLQESLKIAHSLADCWIADLYVSFIYGPPRIESIGTVDNSPTGRSLGEVCVYLPHPPSHPCWGLSVCQRVLNDM